MTHSSLLNLYHSQSYPDLHSDNPINKDIQTKIKKLENKLENGYYYVFLILMYITIAMSIIKLVANVFFCSYEHHMTLLSVSESSLGAIFAFSAIRAIKQQSLFKGKLAAILAIVIMLLTSCLLNIYLFF